jgi:polysaccharide lyase family 4-like protein
MKTPNINFKWVLTLSILFLTVSQGWAYQEVEVHHGGTIQGKAKLVGNMPPPRVYHLVLFPNVDMCAEVDADESGENRVLDDFKVSPNGGLKDVLISLEYVEAGKPFVKEPINILSESCKFTPDMNPIRQGEAFKVDNQDAVMHNSQVYQKEQGKILLNIPIPAEEVSEGKIQFQKNYRIMQMICGMHEFMQTWGYRVQNPYYSQTQIDGNFKIDNIPPGDYVVTAWHYLMKIQSKKIHVSENSVIDLNFDFNGDKVIRPLYETIKSGRIKHDAKVYKEKVFGLEKHE